MTFTLPNIVFVLLLAIMTGYLTFLTAKGGLTDNRFSGYLKKLTRRGKIVLFLLGAIAVVLALQEWNAQRQNDNKEEIINKERSQKDSAITEGIKQGVDSSSKKLYEDISKAFAKQELRLDTVNKNIVKIKDSARTVVNNVSQPDPVLAIDTNGISIIKRDKTSYLFQAIFKSYNNGSSNYEIKSFVFCEYEDKSKEYVLKINLFPNNLKLTPNGKWTPRFDINTEKEIKVLIIYLIGYYTNLDRSKTYPIEILYRFIIKNNHTDVMYDDKKVNYIISLIPKNEL